MNKKQLLHHLQQEVYCRIGASNIHGVGVIAICDIPKGINPFKNTYKGKYVEIKESEFAGLDQEKRNMIDDFFFHESGKIFIPECGLNAIDISFFMNHSDNPNVFSDEEGESFVTIREIKKGQELTYKYFPEDKKTIKKKEKMK